MLYNDLRLPAALTKRNIREKERGRPLICSWRLYLYFSSGPNISGAAFLANTTRHHSSVLCDWLIIWAVDRIIHHDCAALYNAADRRKATTAFLRWHLKELDCLVQPLALAVSYNRLKFHDSSRQDILYCLFPRFFFVKSLVMLSTCVKFEILHYSPFPHIHHILLLP